MKILQNKIKQFTQKSVFKQGGIVLFDQGFLSITNFVTGVFVARACSKEEYGAYVLVWTILLLMVGFHKALVHIPLTVYIPRLPNNEQNSYQGSTLVHTLFISLIFSFIFLLLTLHTTFFEDIELKSPLTFSMLLAILAVPFLLREFIRNALFARLYFTSSLIANFTATVFQLCIIIALFITNDLSLFSSLIAILAGSILSALLMLWSHKDKMVIQLNKVLSDFQRGWNISKWMLVNVIGMIGVSQAYPWLLMLLIDTKAVAIFGAALAISGGLMSPFLRAVNAYILPRMSHGVKDGDISKINSMIRKSVIALLIPYGSWALVGSLFSEELLTLFYTDKYSGHGAILTLLLVKYLIESISMPLTTALQILERPDITTKSLFIGSAITLGAAPFAIMQYSLNGAASIAVLASCSIIVYKYIYIKRILSRNKSA